MSGDAQRERFVEEAIALHDRYQREVIEHLGICPWARQARLGERMRVHVVADLASEEPVAEDVVRRWGDDPSVDVGFIIIPSFGGGFQGLERWGQSLVESVGSAFFAAPFHPDAPPDAGPVRFFRQSPDPTLQLVRRTTLDAVRADDPSHYADIFALTLRDLEPGSTRKTAAARVLEHNRRLFESCGRDALAPLFAGSRRVSRERV